jgi:hypothetical protein
VSDRLSLTIAKGDHRCPDIPMNGNVNQKMYNPLKLPQTEKTCDYLYASIKTGQQQNGLGIRLKTPELHCDTDGGAWIGNFTLTVGSSRF